ncbi:hypothetical protein ElyMa_002617200 [Elysia marginata]|uniref:SRCR domain-containing protein n=1 Tax=Elysia marginata TaxID=1093978 RepID=A0AAV4H4A4_9GAST|nr:hypothetical protein ElyMa_002617200 [Elysia marginata]
MVCAGQELAQSSSVSAALLMLHWRASLHNDRPILLTGSGTEGSLWQTGFAGQKSLGHNVENCRPGDEPPAHVCSGEAARSQGCHNRPQYYLGTMTPCPACDTGRSNRNTGTTYTNNNYGGDAYADVDDDDDDYDDDDYGANDDDDDDDDDDYGDDDDTDDDDYDDDTDDDDDDEDDNDNEENDDT